MTPSCTLVPRKPVFYNLPTFAELWADSRRHSSFMRTCGLAEHQGRIPGKARVFRHYQLHPTKPGVQIITDRWFLPQMLWIENFSTP